MERVSIKDIKPYPNNAKIHTDKQIAAIRDSIQQFGYNDPIAIDKNGEIVEGHGRYEAIKQINSDPDYKINVIRLEGLSTDQQKAYRIAHNKLNLMTDFDLAILKEEFKELDKEYYNDTGFTQAEIDSMDKLFSPTSSDEQGELDKRATVKCPECGHEFVKWD